MNWVDSFEAQDRSRRLAKSRRAIVCLTGGCGPTEEVYSCGFTLGVFRNVQVFGMSLTLTHRLDFPRELGVARNYGLINSQPLRARRAAAAFV